MKTFNFLGSCFCALALIFSLAIFSQPSPCDPQNQDEIFLMVLGDSVTLGVWADNPLGRPNPSFYGELIGVQLHAALLALFKGEKINDLSNAQRYADIIDRNFSYITHREWSGLIGNKSYSLPRLIAREWKRPVKLMAAAILAGCYQLSDLLYARIEDFYRDHPTHRDPDIVVINFNAMDFIFGTSETEFRAHLQRFFQRLATRFPHTTFVVTPLVDIIDVMTDSFEHVTVPGFFGVGTMTCADTYRKVGFGSIINLDPLTPIDRIIEMRERWTRIQHFLHEEIARWDARSLDDPAYASFEGRVIASEPVTPADGSWAPYLAVDCIHPNIQGQRQMGASVWKALTQHIGQMP